jgi:hypothetical protein
MQTLFTFFKTRKLHEEVKRTEPFSLQLVFPGLGFGFPISLASDKSSGKIQLIKVSIQCYKKQFYCEFFELLK